MCTTCACQKRKDENESLCKSGYFELAKQLRENLYLSFSSGYLIHYEEAKRWLAENGRAA
jgi:hypothetical protein